MIGFENVGMRYGIGPEVLRDITLTLPRGSFHFLTGASGAGKSTLLSLITLAQRPSRGRILLFERDVASLPRSELPALRRRIGVVYQDARLIDHMSALDNVALPLRLAGARESQVRKHVEELLEWVGLGGMTKALPATLSGGEQQRVAIARAVISRPDLLVADEPTGNVDEAIGVRLLHLFVELNKMGTTVMVATHNESMLRRFAYPRLRLAQGRISFLEPVARSAS